MAHPEVFFHVGLPKTASTYLQLLVFPRLKGINFFSKRNFDLYKKVDMLDREKRYLFSTETDRGLEVKLPQYASVHPNAKIIIIFRRQDEWIQSKYKYYVRKHGHLTFNEFFSIENGNSFIKKEELYYKDKIKLIEDNFLEKPLVLIFDDLKKNPKNLIDQITSFTNTELNYNDIPKRKVNKAFSKKQISVLQRFNRFYRYYQSKSGVKFFKQIHYRARQYLLHVISFFAGLIPAALIKNYDMLPTNEQLQQIKEFYANDWDHCVNYNNEFGKSK